MTIELSALPSPDILETLDYEAILSQRIAKFKQLWEAVRTSRPELNLPAYDVEMLETDPVIIVLEESAYEELALRARVNDAARANLLAHSTKADLDNLAADHGVTRLTGETDTALRERIVLADQGQSCAGPEEWYKFHARSVSVDIRDVSVYRPGTGPEIEIAILTLSNGGVPTQALLDQVYVHLNQNGIRGFNDVLSVVAAVRQTVNVVAEIWLLPNTPPTVFDGLEAGLREALISEGGIGFDLNTSWIIAKLAVAGIAKVNLVSPEADIVMNDYAAATFGTIALQNKGVSR